MCYPPGIPLICPGEVWTKELIARVQHYQTTGVTILSSYPEGYEIVDTEKWKRFSVYAKRLKDYYENRKTVPSADGYRMLVTFVISLFGVFAGKWINKLLKGKYEISEIIGGVVLIGIAIEVAVTGCLGL